jgi:hypothetical protein
MHDVISEPLARAEPTSPRFRQLVTGKAFSRTVTATIGIEPSIVQTGFARRRASAQPERQEKNHEGVSLHFPAIPRSGNAVKKNPVASRG